MGPYLYSFYLKIISNTFAYEYIANLCPEP